MLAVLYVEAQRHGDDARNEGRGKLIWCRVIESKSPSLNAAGDSNAQKVRAVLSTLTSNLWTAQIKVICSNLLRQCKEANRSGGFTGTETTRRCSPGPSGPGCFAHSAAAALTQVQM